MSKGANIFNHFNPKPSTHKIHEHNGNEVTVLCPDTNDIASGYFTSNGWKCSNCNKTIQTSIAS